MPPSADCYACALTEGNERLIGGLIAATPSWRVEHCMGPLGVGTLIVKPARHVIHVHALDDAEARDMGPLLREAARVVTVLTSCDRTYVSLWSHPNWQPVHIHYVVHMRAMFTNCGPTLQSEMFAANVMPPANDVEAFCDRARAEFRVP